MPYSMCVKCCASVHIDDDGRVTNRDTYDEHLCGELGRLRARAEALAEAVERLARSESFTIAQNYGAELMARMRYARAALRGFREGEKDG